MFERISNDYFEEGVCFGTWIPVWVAAFGEVVHMYEISPVKAGWVYETFFFAPHFRSDHDKTMIKYPGTYL